MASIISISSSESNETLTTFCFFDSPNSSESNESLTTFRFLDLAAEIRYIVYHSLLVLDRPIDVDNDGVFCGQLMDSWTPLTKTTTRPAVEILACCKLIRVEALPYFYKHNIFRVRLGAGHLQSFHRSRFASAERCGLISKIIMHHKGLQGGRSLMNRTRVIEFKKMPHLSRVILRWDWHNTFDMINQAADRLVGPASLCDGLKLLKSARPDVACILLIDHIRDYKVSSWSKDAYLILISELGVQRKHSDAVQTVSDWSHYQHAQDERVQL